MQDKQSSALDRINEAWDSVPEWPGSKSGVCYRLLKSLVKDAEQGRLVHMENLAHCMTEICGLQGEERRYQLAKTLLELTGPLKFTESWDRRYQEPLRAAIKAQDLHLIKLFHEGGSKLGVDGPLVCGMAIGDGFWPLPDLISPSLKTTGDLYGFVYGVMWRKKGSQQDMQDTLDTIERFAQWATPGSVPDRLTVAVSTWQAKRGNARDWIAGNDEYQIETIAALVGIGLDVEPPMLCVQMNNSKEQEERRDIYRRAVPYAEANALGKATASVSRPHSSPRL